MGNETRRDEAKTRAKSCIVTGYQEEIKKLSCSVPCAWNLQLELDLVERRCQNTGLSQCLVIGSRYVICE